VGGVEGVTTRQITEAAEQRNTSAVSYHFGSRQGLLREILVRRGAGVDAERGRLLDAAGPSPSVDVLVRSLVVPYAALLDDAGGRS
jgi:AcrR family transcriptional regulator